MDPQANNIMSCFCSMMESKWVFLFCVSGCFYYQFNLYTIWKAIKPWTEVIINKTPLKIVQSISLQLYPKLNEVLTTWLPCPTAMTNHVRKLNIFKPFITKLDLRVASLSSIQYNIQSSYKTLILIHINKFLIVASMKNSSNKR